MYPEVGSYVRLCFQGVWPFVCFTAWCGRWGVSSDSSCIALPLSREDLLLVMRHWQKSNNKWRGVTIWLRTGGQGHPTLIHMPTPTSHTQKYKKVSYMLVFPLWWPRTNRRTDGRTDKACPQLKDTRCIEPLFSCLISFLIKSKTHKLTSADTGTIFFFLSIYASAFFPNVDLAHTFKSAHFRVFLE